jgi:hypothetical protein
MTADQRTTRARRGAVPSCGWNEPEDNSLWAETPTTRRWTCEGSRAVLRGDGHGYNPGPLWINEKDCPVCGWKTLPWSRVFAPPTCDDLAHQCVEWSQEDQKNLCEIRGGAGDELEYDTVSDTFRFDLGSGPGPQCYVSNPCPGNPAEGAKVVYRMADVTWE